MASLSREVGVQAGFPSASTEILPRITALLQTALPLDEVLHQILRAVTESLDVERAELYMFDERDRVLVGRQAALRHESGKRETSGSLCGVRIPITDTLEVMSAAVLDGETRVIDELDELDDPGADLRLHAAARGNMRSGAFAAVPLLACGQVVGVLTLNDRRGAQPLRRGIPLLNAFAVQAGLAIEKARLYQDRERALRELSHLQKVTTALQGSQPLPEILQRILDGVTEGLDVDRAILYLYDPVRRVLKGTQAALRTPWRETATPEPSLEGLQERVHQVEIPVEGADEVMSATVILRRPFVVDHMTGVNGARRLRISEAIRPALRDHSFVTAPLLAQDRVVGVLTVDNFRRSVPFRDRVHLLMAYGAQAGLAIERTLLEEKLRASEQRYRQFLEQTPDGVAETTLDGRILSCNDGLLRMLGYSREELFKLNARDLYVDPTRRDELLARNEEAGHVEGMQVAVRRKDGRVIYVSASSRLRREPDGEVLECIVRDMTEQRALANISERLQEELSSRNQLDGIIGNSRAMEDVRERIRRVARFTSSVMLMGGSGTGKEIVANAIHYNSPRCRMPIVKVNCAAIPEDLLESELFGIERNVATGVDGRIGRFEMADGGTLFLDEIADMSLATQARILRVLQEREFERVGGKKVIKVDVRIIAATNKELESEIKARRFREDLYYRLNVIVITLPPLAHRRDDIDPLIDHFLAKVTRENDLPRKRVTVEARLLLNEYDWPGNVRELEHCIERAVVMSEGVEITEADLPTGILLWKQAREGVGLDRDAGSGGKLSEILRRAERRSVVDALERSGWVQAKAARLLGISERSMWYRVKKLGLRPPSK